MPWLVGRGPSLDILVRSHSVSISDRIALKDAQGDLTYSQLEGRVNALARYIKEQGSVTTVATMLRNGREAVECLLASQRAGVSFAPLNTWARSSDLEALLAAAKPDLVVVAKEFLPGLEECGYRGQLCVVEDGYEEAIMSQPQGPLWPFGGGAGEVVIHTSGTTGTPKGARRDPAGGGLGSLLDLLGVVPYRRDDVIFCPVPLFHSFGLMTLTVTLSLGATMVLSERFVASEVIPRLSQEKMTAASLTPVMIRRVVAANEGRSSMDLSSLRIVLSSGAFLPPDLRARARSVFGDVVYDLYGSTEAGWVAIATPQDMNKKPSSVGRPAPGASVKIIDTEGSECVSGETGRIGVSGEMVFSGYTGQQGDASQDTMLFTGDVGRFDDDGFLYVEGRSDEMVVIGGENVYPIEVERVIEQMKGVIEAAVIGVEDADLGHRLHAWVEGSVSPDDVKSFCAERIASFKVPRQVSVMDELPRNATGKVLKRKLV